MAISSYITRSGVHGFCLGAVSTSHWIQSAFYQSVCLADIQSRVATDPLGHLVPQVFQISLLTTELGGRYQVFEEFPVGVQMAAEDSSDHTSNILDCADKGITPGWNHSRP
jgi:hypothetical protein